MTPLYLVFPDQIAALAVARVLSGNPDVEALPPDGRLGGIYYNIAEIGTLYADDGSPLPGWHVNGLWRGAPETIPDALRQFMTFPATPRVVWG
jgi:hypothetical protein